MIPPHTCVHFLWQTLFLREVMAGVFDPRLVAEVRLSMISGVGPRTRANLLASFHTPEAVLNAGGDELSRVDGVGPKLASKILAAGQLDAEGELALAEERGISVLLSDEPAYPRLLREIHDPPAVLYAKGALLAKDQMAVAIVGSRHATRYGLQQAERLATGLARAGVTVVSGLARGIDAAAHRGAIAGGGRTLAVLAGGLLRIYPPEHKTLAEDVAANGCLLSEAPPGMPPMSGAFPQRNRVISGLSLGVVVVEAADRSGALITTCHASEQGREAFAVPGPVDSRLSRGCHNLLKDGAKLVADVDDILEELGPLVEAVPSEDGGQLRSVQELNLNELEQRVLQAIEATPTEVDAVVAKSGAAVHRVLATLSVLEMRRLIRRVSGTLVARI
ncbi:MAG: DNA-processing protein DprA [Planctomycetota bacterium]